MSENNIKKGTLKDSKEGTVSAFQVETKKRAIANGYKFSKNGETYTFTKLNENGEIECTIVVSHSDKGYVRELSVNGIAQWDSENAGKESNKHKKAQRALDPNYKSKELEKENWKVKV
jgi:hypothetical protein